MGWLHWLTTRFHHCWVMHWMVCHQNLRARRYNGWCSQWNMPKSWLVNVSLSQCTVLVPTEATPCTCTLGSHHPPPSQLQYNAPQRPVSLITKQYSKVKCMCLFGRCSHNFPLLQFSTVTESQKSSERILSVDNDCDWNRFSQLNVQVASYSRVL